jgi:allantoinase
MTSGTSETTAVPAGARIGAATGGTFALRARRAWVADDGAPRAAWRAATVVVRRGVIASVEPYDADTGLPTAELPDDVVLLPGLVDSHVHVNEPGRTSWEGFATATSAAAAAGVTTIVDMPLNSVPVTTDVAALEAKRSSTAGKLAVDVAFWGGAVPENLGALAPLHEEGVVGFKCFLSPSGIDEFGHLDAGQLRRACAEVAALGSTLIVHAEDPALLHEGSVGARYTDFAATRPGESERSAVVTLVDAVRATGVSAHVVHLADAGSLDLVRAAKAEGLPLTAETCPHYLTLRAEDVPDRSPQYKACPPLRDASNQDGLWAGVLDGTIDLIVSDHSPSPWSMKDVPDGDLGAAWGGIAGLQLGLAATWTEARRRGIALERLLPLFTTGPARLAGLADRGRIAVGAPAHLVAFAPAGEQVVDATALHHRHPVTPWDGRTLTGVVDTTWLHGREVWTRATKRVASRRGRMLTA